MKIKLDKINNKILKIDFKYNKKIVKKIKKIKGRKYLPDGQYWTIPYDVDSLKDFLRIFSTINIEINKTLKNDKKFKKLVKYKFNKEKINKRIAKDFQRKMKLKGYSKNTQKVYLTHINCFFNYQNKLASEIDTKDIKNYLYYLLEDKNSSHSYVNQALSAIKFLYINVFNKKTLIKNISRPKKKKKLPVVLNHKEITGLLNSLTNYKHKLILYITYSGGLRVSEVVRLKVNDIDQERMLIHIKQSKGYKDRYTILSEASNKILNIYIEKYRPIDWLFPGQRRDKHLSIRSAQKIFKKACKKSNIKKDVSIHSLRHYVEC